MADLNIGNSSSSVVVNAKHNGSVTPQINNTYDLGTSDLRWKNIYGDTFVGSFNGNATTANGLKSQGRLDSQEKIDNFLAANSLRYAIFKTTEQNNIGMSSNDGMIISIPWDSTSYGAQIAFDDDQSGLVKFRAKTNGVWGSWFTLLHSGNYNDYAPSKTGSGASGTWSININGNAATATKLATTRTISLTGSVTGSGTFDGSGNLSIATTTNHTHNYAGSASAGGPANSVKTNLIIKLNGGTTEGTNLFTFNGSTAKTINITPSIIGASASGHTHATATTSANGFMSSSDKSKLDGITASADAVSFSRSLTSGTKVGTITINGTGTDLYAPTNTDTKNTTGSTDTSSKIFLVGATSQAANPQTYSDNQVYAQNGQLNGNSIRVAEKVTLQYDVTNECLNFVFN